MKQVLIVDDDPDCLFQLELILKARNYEVIALESQHQAENWLDTHQPDLAILDLMMDREDSGFILSRRIKRDYPDVPVIILTAVTPETGFVFNLSTPENQQWIKANLYLEKGLDQELLLAQVEQLIK